MTLNRLLSRIDSEDCPEYSMAPSIDDEFMLEEEEEEGGGLGVVPFTHTVDHHRPCPSSSQTRAAGDRLHCDRASEQHDTTAHNTIIGANRICNRDQMQSDCYTGLWCGASQQSIGSHTLVANDMHDMPIIPDWNEDEASGPKQVRLPSLSGDFSKLSLGAVRSDSSEGALPISDVLSRLTITPPTAEAPSTGEEELFSSHDTDSFSCCKESEEPQRLYVGRGINLSSSGACSSEATTHELSSLLHNTNCSASQIDLSASVYQNAPHITPDMTIQQDNDGDTLLHSAIIQEIFSLVLAIIGAAPSYSVLNIVNNLSQSPLHLAVLTHQPGVVRLLVAHGARLDARDRHGNTALHLACKLGCLACAKELTRPIHHSEICHCSYQVPFQRMPQDPTILNYSGQSCVHLAASSSNNDLLDYLVSPHASHNINEKHGCTGRTILHDVACRRDKGLVENIVQKVAGNGLDVNCRAFDGVTPLQIALENQDWHIVHLLKMYGAVEDHMDIS